MRRHPWLYLWTAGSGFVITLSGLLAVILRLGIPWWVLIPIGMILLVGLGMGFAKLPPESRARLSRTPHADLKGGLLLGLMVLLLAAGVVGVLEQYARTLTDSQWLVYHLHPVTQTILPYPNQSVVDYLVRPQLPHQVTTDADGFRITPHTIIPNASIPLRILALGDSFTFGLAVDDEETYSYYLELALEKQLGPSYEVTVFNSGISGIAIEDQKAIYAYLMGRGESFEVVTLGYYPGNDLEDITGMPYRREVARTDPVHPWLMAHSALLRWWRRDIYRENIPVYRAGVEELQASLPPKAELKQIYEADFADLVEQIKANGQRLVVMVINAFRDRWAGSEETQFMLDLGEKYGIEVIVPPFRGDADFLEPLDPHYSPTGNAYIADLLAQTIATAYLPEVVYESSAMKVFQQPSGELDVYRIVGEQGVFVGRLSTSDASQTVTSEDGWCASLEVGEGGLNLVLRDPAGVIIDLTPKPSPIHSTLPAR
jgi:hypothetical protein